LFLMVRVKTVQLVFVFAISTVLATMPSPGLAARAGNVAPCRTIAGGLTQLHQPAAVAIGPSGEIAVANESNSITVFANSARGNVAPSRVIAGTETTIDYPTSLTADALGDLFLGQRSRVLEFAPDANGNVAPMRTLDVFSGQGSYVDSIVVARDGSLTAGNGMNTLVRYAPDASGDAAPAFDYGNDRSDEFAIGGLAIDTARLLYVLTKGFDSPLGGGGWYNASVKVLRQTSKARGQPLREITMPNSGRLSDPTGIALDSVDVLWLTYPGGDIIAGFTRRSQLSGRPTYVIFGSRTRLSQPTAIATDGQGNIYVANRKTSSVAEFCR
jgi:hypothetical protein